jgi:hypothetical protein
VFGTATLREPDGDGVGTVSLIRPLSNYITAVQFDEAFIYVCTRTGCDPPSKSIA